MSVATLAERDFAKEVLHHDAPVLVAFRASWCAPSQELAPLVEEVAGKFEGRAKVVSVDVGDDPRTNKMCRYYRVTRVPVVMLFDEGRVKDFVGGATSGEAIGEMVENRLKPVRDDVDAHNFELEVIHSRTPVLAHFTAAWCSTSLELGPIVEEIGEKYRGRAKVVRIEFGGANAALCARYGIVRVPTLVLFHEGRIVDQIFGAMVGGTKSAVRDTSCVGLTSLDNVSQMLEEFVL
jgi:thioredoxin 1